ncbi:hypothetical protein POM88_010219 [Heracleum sosnowskyi]|uniref:Uncharacterized protein n=1 Tax=Heracleum sosnowskyi TaxID=360622 RepID=A0AAD8JAU9_9APIA|nr:hypothetical protein POM88_010219 [Heracleum sosnowskyi]
MGIDPLTHKPIHPDPPTDNYRNHDGQSIEESEQHREEEIKEHDKGQENDEDHHLDKEKEGMGTSIDISIPEVGYRVQTPLQIPKKEYPYFSKIGFSNTAV